ncbi:carbohydrate ABC transporter membrane protein 1, CUT1 family [Alkalispirochaeta americana]|uniref:Carbohydrate ABC transporter membrane protein 1, CUT1 family n=1 Tax=Alkalispirochaeta americana TaxID=159291 RepID=A0A1N6X5I1_9SPIO|nr:sugar ABC transporter permease [Alkalispirochaeta americana]SIQ97585.1 carbohydrate ABC transporter membrane protein 1, CUT1 family [Alkalispirochaeta americana]
MKKNSKGAFIFMCLAPSVVLFTLFMVVPTINVFRMSFYRWGGYSASRTFVGLDNFRILFSGDMRFLQSFQNTVLLISVVSIVTFGISLVFASILSREDVKGKNFFRVVFYIPNILSVVIISAIFSAIYEANNGMLNSIISFFDRTREPVYWLGDNDIVIFSIAGAMVWQAIGYYMVMYMASMASVPESLYESANLEGAGKIHQFFRITVPLIWSNIRTTMTFFIISSINLSFLFVTAMTNGGPDGASEVFLSYMYRQAYTNSSYGYGMAIGVVVFTFSFALSGIVNLVTYRDPIEI